VPKPVKTRSHFAGEITALFGRSTALLRESFDVFLEMCLTLIRAKDGLPHGEFLKMVECDLPFDASKAQRLMKIGRDPRIANAARAQLLPKTWSVNRRSNLTPHRLPILTPLSGGVWR
jgi:hypothetical protein